MSIKSQLNEAIKWTSSKFNEYRKPEIIDKILEMKPNTWLHFECGSFSENSWYGGYSYTVHRTNKSIEIFNSQTNDCIAYINIGGK